MLQQVNALRAQNGLGALTWNGQLATAAAAHSQYLATNAYVGPHVEANGSTPQSRAAGQGYGGRVGENVVGGSTATLEWAWNWWLNSAVHLSNMLGDWNEVGIAVAEGSYGRWYTMDFGDNGGGSAPPAPAPVNTSSGGQNTAANGGGGSAPAQPPRPTKPPPPTATPTITLTPSLTFTPRASFTPLPTGTALPPTETPIMMDLTVAEATATLEPPTATIAATVTKPEPTAQAVAMLPTQETLPSPKAADAASASNSPARTVIPIVIGLQLVVVGLLAIRAVLRRGKR
ncbi:MAG: hypothetical protein KF716_23640 [Anaerolineae bacterium]|nr:hypothetical protein [Anaerolineae bacterium]